MKSVLIVGGSGLIGGRLAEMLSNEVEIKILTRRDIPNTEKIKYFKWDTEEGILEREALNSDVIINLAGEGIADKRWTDERKKVLVDSRVKPNELIIQKLKEYNIRPKVFIGASAIGFYGDRGAEVLTEESKLGKGFLSECSEKWENSYLPMKELSDRFCLLRIGVVLSNNGGALPELLKTSSVGFLSYFGDGSMYYSWIHIDDVCNIIIKAINDERYSGIINTVSPTPITNKDLVQTMGSVYNKITIPAPKFGLRLVLGEMADVVLNSTRVIPQKLISLNHRFDFPKIEDALKDLKKNKK